MINKRKNEMYREMYTKNESKKEMKYENEIRSMKIRLLITKRVTMK
jgi:hypothetical protein